MSQLPSARKPKVKRAPPVSVNPAGPEGVTWDEAVEKFLADRAGKNRTTGTIENYRWLLTGPRSTAFRADQGIVYPRDLTKEKLTNFSTELLAAGLSPATVQAFHRGHKVFATWCLDEKMGVEEAILRAKGPSQPQRDFDTYSVSDEKALMAAARSPRDRLIVEFFLHTGLRLSEVCAVTLDNFKKLPNGAQYVQVVQGKGRKDRFVPLDTKTYKLSAKIAHFISHDRDKSEDNHLFLTERQVAWKEREDAGMYYAGVRYAGLKSGAMQMIVRRLAAKAGIDGGVHRFRHTFATRALQAGVNMVVLKDILGHTSLAMTNEYLHYAKEDLVAAWSAMP